VQIAVLGQGYVGLPLSIAMASAGHVVHAVDIDPERYRALVEGRCYIVDVSSDQLRGQIDAGRFRPAWSLDRVPPVEAYVVATPTPLSADLTPDLKYVDASIAAIADHAESGALIVVESTIYPGALRNHIAPLFERLSGLVPGIESYLAYSPDRVDPGRGQVLREIPKLIAGLDEASDAMAAKLYETVFDQIVRVPSCEVAEFT
jgi:UDP-N-acetyl-D-glucosamine dehydrogenase